MIYISPNNEYPRHIGDIQISYPDFKEGEVLPEGWVEVTQVDRPEVGQDEIVYEDFPTEVDGVMTQNWVTRPMTAEEIERRDAPHTARQKLLGLGLTQTEIDALAQGLVR